MNRAHFLVEAHAAQHVAVMIGDVVKRQHLAQLGARRVLVGVERHPRLGDDLDLARIAAGFDGAFAHPRGDLFHLRRRRHVDKHTVGDFANQFGHLRSETREINRHVGITRLPGKLKALAGGVNLPFVLDPFAGGDLAHHVDVFARALERPVEDTAMPAGDRLVGDTEPEQQAAAGQILQRRRLNAEGHRAAAVNMVNRRAQFDFFRPARHRRQHDEWVGAVRFAFPKGAEADLLGQFDEPRHVGGRIVRRGIDLNVKNHMSRPSLGLDIEPLHPQNLNEITG